MLLLRRDASRAVPTIPLSCARSDGGHATAVRAAALPAATPHLDGSSEEVAGDGVRHSDVGY